MLVRRMDVASARAVGLRRVGRGRGPVLPTLALALTFTAGCTVLNPEFGLDADTEGYADDALSFDGSAGDDMSTLDGGADADEGADADADGGPIGSCDDDAVCFEDPGPPWQGPLAAFEREDVSQGNPCGGSFSDSTYVGSFGIQADPVQCSDCSCNEDAKQLGSCGPMTVSVHGNADCSDSSMFSFQFDPNKPCEKLEDGGGDPLSSANIIVPPGAATGTCGASEVLIEDTPPITLGGTAYLCGGGDDRGACTDSEGRCIGRPDALAIDGLCVQAPGEIACPPGFPLRHVYGSQLEDGRDCSDCACGLDNAECAVDVTSFYDDACATPNPSSPIEIGICGLISTNQVGSAAFGDPYLLPGASCVGDPAGGQPTGKVKFADAVTVCCTG